MKSKLLSAGLLLSTLAIGCLSQKDASTTSGSTANGSAKIDRTVLPVAPPNFEGKIGMALKDSTSGWPEPMKAPKGAPNVLLIMGDDIGCP